MVIFKNIKNFISNLVKIQNVSENSPQNVSEDNNVVNVNKTPDTSNKWYQRVSRVLDSDSLDRYKYCHGFSMWHSEYTDDPKVIGKIFEHLRTAYSIKLYITNAYIEYSAITKKHGFVCGGCHRMGPYSFFEFGLSRTGHRWDIYDPDRDDPTIKAFYEWWGNLVKPYEEEFDNDYNL